MLLPNILGGEELPGGAGKMISSGVRSWRVFFNFKLERERAIFSGRERANSPATVWRADTAGRGKTDRDWGERAGAAAPREGAILARFYLFLFFLCLVANSRASFLLANTAGGVKIFGVWVFFGVEAAPRDGVFLGLFFFFFFFFI
jgi:hypothetical protein